MEHERVTVSEVLAAAMSLSNDDRVVLAIELLDLIDHPPPSQAEVDSAWTAEIQHRADDLATGRVQPIDADEMFARLQASRATRRNRDAQADYDSHAELRRTLRSAVESRTAKRSYRRRGGDDAGPSPSGG